MKVTMMNVLLVSLSRGRSGIALASNHVVGKIGVRSPINAMPAFVTGHRATSRSRCISRPLATVPTTTKPASSLKASLRDILDAQKSTAPNPPTPAAAAPTPPADLTTPSDDVLDGGGMGGMMKSPLNAAPLTTTVNGRKITTTPNDPTSSSTPKKSYVDPIISITDTYDSGNGEFVSLKIVDGEEEQDYCDVYVYVKIKPDPFTTLENKQHFQYFSFRSALNPNSPAMKGLFSGKKSLKVKYILQNAGEASFAGAFKGYSTFVTTKMTPFDPDSWERKSDASYDGGRLSWTHVHELGEDGSAAAYFAYFPPYSQERHLGLIGKCAEAKGATVKSLGPTIEGREIDFITVGTGPRTCWIIHRQHPGESMAEFYAEGLLNRLLGLNDKCDEVAEKARELYTFHIVPNINPDGSSSGYLRTNAAGQNLNREWCPSPAPLTDDDADADMYEAPTLERSPEVYHLLRHMDQTGCDAFLDIHGDEDLPFNFLAGSEGMTVWGKRLESLHGAFLASYERANGDMQAKVSYDPDEAGGGMPNICSNQIAERFDCFSGTLEMPFKECWSDTMGVGGNGKKIGWGPERARQLGASVLDALCYISPHLRDEGEFWDGLSEDDAYVRPSSKY